jgi:hypothetical protein
MYITRQLWNFRLSRTNLGVQTHGGPTLACFDSLRKVQSQHCLGRSAYCCKRNNLTTIKAKVFRPSLIAGIKQCDQLTTYRIKGSNVGAFETVAVETSQCKIGKHSLATVFKGDEMIGFVRKEGL